MSHPADPTRERFSAAGADPRGAVGPTWRERLSGASCPAAPPDISRHKNGQPAFAAAMTPRRHLSPGDQA
ncbi:hypothetical protein [Edwardsiella anguillarum]|uniref:Uncharacterized protein n=2 Tax=Edwardsiella anguillarum TaxID=1821960 RepID=A0A076LU81_9GAMM|nr:hypothetical protein [Edwardsiella anguillarum]AKM48615.1 hypothetical protein QY76_16075 [Edwardsiella sp. EA181011]AIJ09129.1 Hypothetical protein ETEE_2696 [Edwardsiella anguillarum ET080813]KAB0590016.1 hypothetical protein F7P84_13365 [Edwardsiella anguillarum]MDA6076112.1 hypothetical protein [Edwardsiella anguillarum]RFS99756.1 hypothetical protein CGL57_18050 [Edwardsiella anguillarum]